MGRFCFEGAKAVTISDGLDSLALNGRWAALGLVLDLVLGRL